MGEGGGFGLELFVCLLEEGGLLLELLGLRIDGVVFGVDELSKMLELLIRIVQLLP